MGVAVSCKLRAGLRASTSPASRPCPSRWAFEAVEAATHNTRDARPPSFCRRLPRPGPHACQCLDRVYHAFLPFPPCSDAPKSPVTSCVSLCRRRSYYQRLTLTIACFFRPQGPTARPCQPELIGAEALLHSFFCASSRSAHFQTLLGTDLRCFDLPPHLISLESAQISPDQSATRPCSGSFQHSSLFQQAAVRELSEPEDYRFTVSARHRTFFAPSKHHHYTNCKQLWRANAVSSPHQ
jgi:hypothetical protein